MLFGRLSNSSSRSVCHTFLSVNNVEKVKITHCLTKASRGYSPTLSIMKKVWLIVRRLLARALKTSFAIVVYVSKSMAVVSINLLLTIIFAICSAALWLRKLWIKASTPIWISAPSDSAEATQSRYMPSNAVFYGMSNTAKDNQSKVQKNRVR